MARFTLPYLLLWLAAVACPLVATAEPRPNIVFILADDLGYTDLATYGSRYYETPNIDRLAAEGLKFTNGYSCGPNCQPTRAALMSGQYGPRTGVYTVGSIDRFPWQTRSLRPVDNLNQLPEDKVTLAQVLKKAGYATGMFGKWHLGNKAELHPSRRGFDEAIVSDGRHFDFQTQPKVDVPKGAYLADFLTDKAEGFIRQHQGGLFFLYLPHFGVHSPFQAKEELIAKFKDKPAVGGHQSAVYAAMIASVDESVGRILALLDELKLADNTLVIFSSDNGGVGGYTREGIDASGITDNAPLRGGKGMLYEGGVRVPYLFRWKGAISPGTVCAEPVNSVDLLPTLAELGQASPPAGQVLDGVSYARLLKASGKGTLGRPALFWHFPGYLGAGGDTWRTTPAGAVRAGDWKLIEFFEDGRKELYNLAQDEGEKVNLASQEEARVLELHTLLKQWRESVGAKMPTPNQPQLRDAKKGKGKKQPKNAPEAE